MLLLSLLERWFIIYNNEIRNMCFHHWFPHNLPLVFNESYKIVDFFCLQVQTIIFPLLLNKQFLGCAFPWSKKKSKKTLPLFLTSIGLSCINHAKPVSAVVLQCNAADCRVLIVLTFRNFAPPWAGSCKRGLRSLWKITFESKHNLAPKALWVMSTQCGWCIGAGRCRGRFPKWSWLNHCVERPFAFSWTL